MGRGLFQPALIACLAAVVASGLGDGTSLAAGPAFRPGLCTAPAAIAPLILTASDVASRNTSGAAITAQPGQSVLIVPVRHAPLVIHFNITTANGTNAPDTTTCGQNAGDIEIGNNAAIAGARKAGLKTRELGSPSILTITGTMTTGNGGDGFDDLTGFQSIAHPELILNGTRAGRGGDISIAALKTDLSELSIVIGSGGKGGDAGRGIHAADGIDGSPDGEGLEFFTGDGGDAGSFTPFVAKSVTKGQVGNAGSVNASAGNGGGDGGDGGFAVGRMGLPGLRKPDPAKAGSATFVGSGNGAVGTALRGGGNGGPLSFTDSLRVR
jgi:hypothetical protein